MLFNPVFKYKYKLYIQSAATMNTAIKTLSAMQSIWWNWLNQ